MAEEQELPEDGKISVEMLREKTEALDLFLPCTADVIACLKNPRPPSEILRTKEYVIEWARKRKIKGRIKMFDVEVDV